MFSSAQQQLLQLLKIQPLQLRAEFSNQTLVPALQALDLNSTTLAAPILAAPEISHAIFLDILSLFQQSPVTTESSIQLGSLSWSIDSHATEVLLTNSKLITPPLSLLQQPTLKRQLWQQLSRYLEQL